MKNWFSKLLAETTQEGRNAFRVAVVMIGAAFFTLPLDLYLAIQSDTWQMYLILISASAFLILAVISAALARKNRAGIAMALITGGLYILLPEIAALISGLGLILSITQVVVIVTIVGQTLSGPPARRAVIIGVISAILTLLIDLLAPWKRVSSPALQTEIPYIVAAIVLALGIYFIRNFRDYSVRVKLLLGFLSVVVLASSGGAGAILQQSRSAEKTALTEASTLAGTLSSIVISNQVDLQSFI